MKINQEIKIVMENINGEIWYRVYDGENLVIHKTSFRIDEIMEEITKYCYKINF